MEWAFFAVFALVAAMIFNFVNPKITAMQWAQSPSLSGYAGRTLITGAAFFVVLIAAGFIMSLVAGRKAVENPAG